MRAFAHAILVLVLVAAVAFIAFGLWSSGRPRDARVESPARVGTSGQVDVATARERAGELGEKAAIAVQKVEETATEAALTTKIKAKMALDDSVKARAIDVSTSGSTVTLSGTVRSAREHDRAVALARETAGVTSIVDHLRIAE